LSDSPSKIPIKITLIDKGEATGYLNRLTAPLTVGEIMNMLPLNTRTSPAMGFVSIIVGIKRGTEKPVDQVKAGTIGYWPRGDAITIYTKDARPYGPVNRIGVVENGLELFKGLRSGSRIIIEKV
jgi:hypothetical protein